MEERRPIARIFLGFNLVDLLERHGALVGRGHAALEERRPVACVFSAMALQHFALAQLAQLIELAAAHKVIAALALNHLLELLFAEAFFTLRVHIRQVGPVGGGVAHKLDHLGQQTGKLVFCHIGCAQWMG